MPDVGQAMSFFSGGSTVNLFDKSGKRQSSYMTKPIHGATLTKAGK
jgi:hypothetical protein